MLQLERLPHILFPMSCPDKLVNGFGLFQWQCAEHVQHGDQGTLCRARLEDLEAACNGAVHHALGEYLLCYLENFTRSALHVDQPGCC